MTMHSRRSLPLLPFLVACGALLAEPPPAAAGRDAWTTAGRFALGEGTFADAGANAYVSAAGDVRLINQWDLNRDGFLDLFFFNTHDNNQQIDLYLYWGGRNFSVDARTRLPSDGGAAQVIADLDGNGYPDLVVVNTCTVTGAADGPAAVRSSPSRENRPSASTRSGSDA